MYIIFLQVAITKGNEKVGKWSNQVINHFWHCSSVASEYEDTTQALAAMKVDIPQTNCSEVFRIYTSGLLYNVILDLCTPVHTHSPIVQ